MKTEYKRKIERRKWTERGIQEGDVIKEEAVG